MQELERPNLFKYATSELSQDAFFCWFLEWANEKYANVDKDLHSASKDFCNTFFFAGRDNVEVKTLKLVKQFKHMDITITINDKYLIIIEDKTYTHDSKGQLNSYKEQAIKYCNEKKYETPILVYLKNTYQSKYSLNEIEKKGWKLLLRKNLIDFFGRYEYIKNNIFVDYKNELIKLNDKIISFRNCEKENWTSKHYIGFFEFLGEKLPEDKTVYKLGYGNSKGNTLEIEWYTTKICDGANLALKVEKGKGIDKKTNKEKRGRLAIILRVKDYKGNKKDLNKHINKITTEIASNYKEIKILNNISDKNNITIARLASNKWLGDGGFDETQVISNLEEYQNFITTCAKEYKK